MKLVLVLVLGLIAFGVAACDSTHGGADGNSTGSKRVWIGTTKTF